MAKKRSFKPNWLLIGGGLAALYLILKPKAVNGIGMLPPEKIGEFYSKIDRFIEVNPEKAYRVLNKIFKKNFDTWLTKKVNGKIFWNNKFITNMTNQQLSDAFFLMDNY